MTRPATGLDPSSRTTIGTCTILETVATSAFTVTYRSVQSPIGRTVLLKALKPTILLGSPHAAALEREAAVLGKLSDSAIPTLFEVLRTETELGLVFEDTKGTPLREVLAATRLEPVEAAAIAREVARAMAVVHGRGIVHRSLRAEIVALGEGGRVLLRDFSTAAQTGDDVQRETELPGTIEPGVSRYYMAPEQILDEPSGPRADVWALGVLLYELLTGARPFDAEHPRDLAPKIRAARPEPLPDEVPRPLEPIVARCLAKDPDDRFSSARPLLDALSAALSSLTRLPASSLIERALARAGFGDLQALPDAEPEAPPQVARPSSNLRYTAASLALVFALIVAGGGVLRLLRDEDTEGQGTPTTEEAARKPTARGMLRVVALPWAEVYVDGDFIDVTPIGRPILIAPGKHFVTFRHPSAPDEQRTIRLGAGQTVFLDVSMRIDRGDAGAPKPDGGQVDSP